MELVATWDSRRWTRPQQILGVELALQMARDGTTGAYIFVQPTRAASLHHPGGSSPPGAPSPKRIGRLGLHAIGVDVGSDDIPSFALPTKERVKKSKWTKAAL
jgi:hypothetical protein